MLIDLCTYKKEEEQQQIKTHLIYKNIFNNLALHFVKLYLLGK